jgi:tubulin-specific chaperone E
MIGIRFVKHCGHISREFCLAILHMYQSSSSLQRLILTSNHIDKIFPLQDDHLQLRCLKQLSLSFNLLSSWSDIDSLSRWCPGLENLSITGNPLVEGMMPETVR